MGLKNRLIGLGTALALAAGGTVALAPAASAGANKCSGDVCLRVNGGGLRINSLQVYSERWWAGYKGHYEVYGTGGLASLKGNSPTGDIKHWQLGGSEWKPSVNWVAPSNGKVCARVWGHEVKNGTTSYRLRGETCIDVYR